MTKGFLEEQSFRRPVALYRASTGKKTRYPDGQFWSEKIPVAWHYKKKNTGTNHRKIEKATELPSRPLDVTSLSKREINRLLPLFLDFMKTNYPDVDIKEEPYLYEVLVNGETDFVFPKKCDVEFLKKMNYDSVYFEKEGGDDVRTWFVFNPPLRRENLTEEKGQPSPMTTTTEIVSFKEFLEEKLSRKDIDIGLSDPNVRIGLEFEFILNPDTIMDKKTNEVKSFEKLKIWKDFPFKGFQIGSYHNSRANVSHWRIENDSSLTKGGVEVISPALPMKDSVSALKSVLDFIKKYGYTDRSCGLHVNMSYANKSFKDLDKLKLVLFMDEGWVYDHFSERQNNPYAKSVLKRAIEDLTIGGNDNKNNPEQRIVADKMFDDYKTTMRNTPAEKYLGINFSHIFKEDGSNRIEFRYLGGPDYDKKYQKIVATMGRYSAYLSIAFDENTRKREYIQKLIRIQNKIIEMQDLLDSNPIAKESAIPEAFIQQYAVDQFTIDSMKSNINFLSFDDENKVKINFLMKKKLNEISSFILLRKNTQSMSIIDRYMNVEFGYSKTTQNSFVILPVK